MGKKKTRIIIICIFLVLMGAIISFLIHMKGNEDSKMAWNALRKDYQEKVIGGGYFLNVKTIKPKENYRIPDVPVYEALGEAYYHGYFIVKDEIILIFKDGVPDIIARIKIALMDGVIVDSSNGMYVVRINGIGVERLDKLMDKLDNDPVISGVGVNPIVTTNDLAMWSQGSENVKNKSIKVVTFYYFKNFKLNKYIVYIDKEAGKTFVIDTENPYSTIEVPYSPDRFRNKF